MQHEHVAGIEPEEFLEGAVLIAVRIGGIDADPAHASHVEFGADVRLIVVGIGGVGTGASRVGHATDEYAGRDVVGSHRRDKDEGHAAAIGFGPGTRDRCTLLVFLIVLVLVVVAKDLHRAEGEVERCLRLRAAQLLRVEPLLEIRLVEVHALGRCEVEFAFGDGEGRHVRRLLVFLQKHELPRTQRGLDVVAKHELSAGGGIGDRHVEEPHFTGERALLGNQFASRFGGRLDLDLRGQLGWFGKVRRPPRDREEVRANLVADGGGDGLVIGDLDAMSRRLGERQGGCWQH